MNKLYSCLIFLLVVISIHAQQWTWAMHVPGAYLGRIDEDSFGNIYTGTGIASSPGWVSELTKRNSSGQTIWTTTLNCSIYDLKTTNSSLVFAGSFTGTFVIGSYTLNSQDGLDAFVASSDLNGNIQWVKHCAGISDNYIYSVDQNSAGDVFIAATNDSTTTFMGQSFNAGIAVCILDSSGNLINNFAISSPNVLAKKITLDQQNNIYILGVFNSTIAIGTTTLNNGGSIYSDYFLAKFQQNGTAYWAKDIGGTYKSDISGLAINSANDIYYTNCFTYDNDLLFKLSPNGTLIWHKNFGGDMYGIIPVLKIDNADNLYVTGGTWYNAGVGSCSVSGTGNFLYVAKADSSGTCHWIAKGQSPSDSRGLALSIKNSSVTILGFTMANPIQLSPFSVNGSYFLARLSQTSVTGINEEAKLSGTDIYPNPTNGLLNVQLQEQTSLTIYNLTGTCIYKNTASAGEKKIDLRQQPKGLYFLELSGSHTKSVKKIVVE